VNGGGVVKDLDDNQKGGKQKKGDVGIRLVGFDGKASLRKQVTGERKKQPNENRRLEIPFQREKFGGGGGESLEAGFRIQKKGKSHRICCVTCGYHLKKEPAKQVS